MWTYTSGPCAPPPLLQVTLPEPPERDAAAGVESHDPDGVHVRPAAFEDWMHRWGCLLVLPSGVVLLGRDR
jgi:hypothetical protein